jgi:tRNA threonylcarbamoyladenosine biosynthesis protein TsaE
VSLVPHNHSLSFTLENIIDAAKFCISYIVPGGTYVFTGDLGAGKTTLIRSVIAEMGCSDTVSSPTYVLQHVYSGFQYGISEVEHWDLYRTQILPEEIEQSVKKSTIRFIEWGEKFPELQPNGRFTLSIIDDSTRILDFNILN